MGSSTGHQTNPRDEFDVHPYTVLLRFRSKWKPKRLAALWLLILTALPCQSQEDAGLASPKPLVASSNFDALHHYHLPRSNNHSIYFLPGSAELGESARQALSDTAAHLSALPHLMVKMEAYSDEFEDAAYGTEVRKARAEATIDALQELNIPRRRIVVTAGSDSEHTSSSCTSEYCRQSYRRVRLEFSRTSDH